MCVCIPVLVTTFPEWLSGTELLRHTPARASVLVYVVFCVHMYSFAGLIRWTPLPTFSDTTITGHHSDTTIFQLRAHWVQMSWSNRLLDRKNRSDMSPGGSRTFDFLHTRQALYPLGQALRILNEHSCVSAALVSCELP